MKRIWIFFLLLSLCIPFACKKDAGLTVFHSFPDRAWNRFEKQTFDFLIENTSATYDMTLILRHTDDYPFENLYMHVIMEMPGGEERIGEYDFNVKGPGEEFLSRVSKGGYREITFSLHKGLRFAETGICRVEMENLIPKIEIPGIIALGISLQRSSKE